MESFLSYVLTTSNRNDAVMATELFAFLEQRDIEFTFVGTAFYSEKV
jgi:hypothetical protein